MKKLLCLLCLLALPCATITLHAQSTNAPSISTNSVTTTIYTTATNAAPRYLLVYNPATLKVVAMPYTTGKVSSPFPVTFPSTWAAAQAFCATNNLTGLPPKKTGQP